MGAETPAPPRSEVLVVRAGRPLDRAGRFEVVLEDGTETRIEGGALIDLPFGYHSMRSMSDGTQSRLIVSPGRCYLPEGLRTWGWAVQLYSLHSSSSWGIGDLGDLLKLARWAKGLGSGMLLLNPLHAADPGQPSPYYPSSRCFRNPLYIDVEDVARRTGAGSAPAEPRALSAEGTIDRLKVHEAKMGALEALWARRADSPSFEAYLLEGGEPLRAFARLAAEASGSTDEEGVRFHMWLQWLLHEQLKEAQNEIDVVHDLAIGADPGGADVRIWDRAFAHEVRIGAPPDEFSATGQDWGMPPFDPWKLRALDYEPYIQTVRASMSSGAGVRIDHVMGLFRLWWIPEGAEPTEGAYVRYPKEDLLDILALESHRARSYVIGEDLGTVEPGVREEMEERSLLSYRVMWFESSPPDNYPELALAAVTNHDLPTIAGVWTGSDLQEQRDIGLEIDEEAEAHLRGRLREHAQVADDASVEEVIERTYGALARAPSRLKVATLEDACAMERKPNQPGTSDERPNWSLRLTLSIEELTEAGLPERIARALKG
jgi:4-alpha-glucanotransferase